MKNFIYILIFLLTLQVNLFAAASADLEAGDTEYFLRTSANVSNSATISFFNWFKAESDHIGSQLNVASGTVDNIYSQLGNDVTTRVARMNTRDASVNPAALSSNQWTIGEWIPHCGVRYTLSSRSINLNGTITNETTTNSTNGVYTRTGIGVLVRLTLADYFDGLLAYSGIWNVALSVDEQNELVLGIPPIYVQTNNCKGFYPLNEASGNALDKSGNGYDMTETSGTIDRSSDGPPRVFIPMGGQ
jgi:hypothetical protein